MQQLDLKLVVERRRKKVVESLHGVEQCPVSQEKPIGAENRTRVAILGVQRISPRSKEEKSLPLRKRKKGSDQGSLPQEDETLDARE